MSSRLTAYALAALIGVCAAALALPLETVLGGGPGWAEPNPDAAQALTGHLAFQYDAWRWPLLEAQTLFWPRGVSIALSDSNPLFSLLAKFWTKISGHAPINLLGAWEATYWILQPVAAVYAARGLRLTLLPALAAGILAACWPALLFRVGHINLCGHFLLLLSLGLVFRRIGAPAKPGILGRWRAPFGVLLTAILVQPYLYMLCVGVLASIPLHAVWPRRPHWRGDLAGFLAAIGLPVLILNRLSGPLGGGDKGFVFFSMNLISPIWPQISGVFGANLPVIDGTGGQYEGFNWLGAGVILLLVVALALALKRSRPAGKPWRAAIVVLSGLALMSLSSRVYAGPIKIIDLGAKPWEDIFAVFRVPGRAFWPVGYAIMLFAVAATARLPRGFSGLLLAVACVLQFIDSGPLRANEWRTWSTSTIVTAPPVPAGTQRLTLAPYSGCSKEYSVRASEESMLLAAARRGITLGEIGLGRAPSWFGCEMIPSEMLETPLAPGEVRGFFDADMRARLKPQLFGPESSCADNGIAILCGRDVGPLPGTLLPPPEPMAPLDLPASFSARQLEPVLGYGWRIATDGAVWSEGPLNSLILPVPRDTDISVTLTLAGIAFRAGDVRDVTISAADGAPAATAALPDGTPRTISFGVPARNIPDGILRLVMHTIRPVDPARRGITAPAGRVALKLDALAIRRDGTEN